MKEFIYYKVLWEGFPPEAATWEPESEIHDDLIDEFEAALEAEAELEAEEKEEQERRRRTWRSRVKHCCRIPLVVIGRQLG